MRETITLCKLIDENKINPERILRDILINYFDKKQANRCARFELVNHGFTINEQGEIEQGEQNEDNN